MSMETLVTPKDQELMEQICEELYQLFKQKYEEEDIKQANIYFQALKYVPYCNS